MIYQALNVQTYSVGQNSDSNQKKFPKKIVGKIFLFFCANLCFEFETLKLDMNKFNIRKLTLNSQANCLVEIYLTQCPAPID